MSNEKGVTIQHANGKIDTLFTAGGILEMQANTAKTPYYRGRDWLRNRLRSLGEGEER